MQNTSHSIRLILASASATRLQLLRGAGLAIMAQAASVDENSVKNQMRRDGCSADDIAFRLAGLKAAQVSQSLNHPDALVIGADQILICGMPGSISRAISPKPPSISEGCVAVGMSCTPPPYAGEMA